VRALPAQRHGGPWLRRLRLLSLSPSRSPLTTTEECAQASWLSPRDEIDLAVWCKRRGQIMDAAVSAVVEFYEEHGKEVDEDENCFP